MLSELGFTVLRQIPSELLPGLVTGAYSLHGGVLRDGAGRIVAHLLTAGPADLLKSLVPGLDVLSGLVGNGQIFALSRSVEALQSSVATVVQLSAAGTIMAGLGLVATAGGVAYLNGRLNGIERHLERLEDKLDDVRRSVVTYQLAVLKGAMDNLRHAEQYMDGDRRQGMLLDAKRDFQTARHNYSDRLKDASTSGEFAALEECLSLAMTGSALCASELELYDIAATDFESQLAEWQESARRFVQGWVDSTGYGKLLEVPTDEVPTDELVALLDFGEGTNRGWARIDELRRATKAQEHAQRKETFRSPWPRKAVRSESTGDVRTAMVLRQRSLILQAHGEHLKFLASRRMSGGAFATHAKEELAHAGADALFVLAPPARLATA